MARRKRKITEKALERKRKAGKGQGTGDNFKPWQDIKFGPSKGSPRRAKGWLADRLNGLFSLLEWAFFLVFEAKEHVVDIREQYRLDLEITSAIADQLGIRHPTHPGTNILFDMTTDLVITFWDGS